MTHPESEHVVVIGPDGRPVTSESPDSPQDATAQPSGNSTNAPDEAGDAAEEREETLADMVEQPAKVMRIGTMIKQLLEEVRAAPLDDASRNRLKEIHQASIKELEAGLAEAQAGMGG